MCVIEMAATYTVFFPASLWRTTTVSPLPPPMKGMGTSLSKCTQVPRSMRPGPALLLGVPAHPGAQASHKGPTGGQCGVQYMQVPPHTHTHGRQQLVCSEVGEGILGKESCEGQRQGDGGGELPARAYATCLAAKMPMRKPT